MWSSIPEEVIPAASRVTPANLGYPPFPLVPRGRRVTVQDDGAHLLSQLPEGDFDLFAHSYGGLMALELLPALQGRLRSLFLLEPVLFGALSRDLTAEPAAAAQAREFEQHPWFLTDEARGGTEPWLEHFIDYWNRPGAWARMPEPMRVHNLTVGWKMFQEVRSVFLDPKTFDERVLPQLPVTLVMGERSPAASREMVRSLARRNPHAKVVELPGTGHMAPLTHAGKVHEAMAQHLRGVTG